MRTSVDRFGRVVIPKELRDRLGLTPGAPLELEAAEDRLELRLVGESATTLLDGGVLVFAGEATGDLGDAVDRGRRDRVAGILGGQQ